MSTRELYRLAFRLTLALLPLGLAVPGGAQPIPVGTLRVEVRAAAGADGELRWVLARLPEAADIALSEAGEEGPGDLRDRILAALAPLRAPECAFVGLLKEDCSLLPALKAGVEGLVVRPPPPRLVLRPKPEDLNAPGVTAELRLLYLPRLAPPAIARLHLQVATASWRPDLPAVAREAAALAAFEVGGAVPAAVDVELGYTGADLPGRPREEVERELLAVAARAWLAAREQGIVPGAGFPADASANQASTTIRTDLSLQDIWPAPGVSLKQGEPGSWSFRITGLRFLEAVRIAVVANPVPGIEAELEARYLPLFLLAPGRIPGLAALAADMARLTTDQRVASVAWKREGEAGLVAEVQRVPRITRYLLKGALGYSAERQLTGTAAAEGRGALGRGSTATLSFEGSEEFTALRAGGVWGWNRAKRRTGLRLEGWSSVDRDQLLGDGAAGRVEERRRGGAAHLTVELDSFSLRDHRLRAEGFDAGRKRARFFTNSELTLALGNAEVAPRHSGSAVSTLEDTRLTQAGLEIAELVSVDLRRGGGGLGQWDLWPSLRLDRGFAALGGERAYDRFLLRLRTQLFFGRGSPADFLVRYSAGVGRSRGDAPLAEQFRLGGPANVRGLEEGERIGGDLIFDQTEVGVSLDRLKRLLPSARSKTPDGAAPAQPGAPGFDLASTYLKLFYDRGRVGDGGAGGLLSFAGSLAGYGAAFELRDLPLGDRHGHLTLGWARSPDSPVAGRHRSGLVTTGLSLDF